MYCCMTQQGMDIRDALTKAVLCAMVRRWSDALGNDLANEAHGIGAHNDDLAKQCAWQ